MTTTATSHRSATPLFGVDLTPDRELPFRLRSYGPRDPETGRPRETDHEFTARAEVDAATALGTMRGGAAAQAGVFVRFLQRTLLDDDGVSQKAVLRRVTPDEDDDQDDDGTEPGAELEVAGAGELQMPGTEWELDGQRFPSRDLALQHGRENGSSLRRFADLMDDPDERVKMSALKEIVEYVAKESGGRPTAPSKPSRKPPTRRKGR